MFVTPTRFPPATHSKFCARILPTSISFETIDAEGPWCPMMVPR